MIYQPTLLPSDPPPTQSEQPPFGGDWQLDVEQVTAEEPPVEPPFLTDPKSVREVEVRPPAVERIVEALCFAAKEPVLDERACQIIRGLTATQLQEAVSQLNLHYRTQARPYVIERLDHGYQLKLRARHRGVLEQLHRGVKEARFSVAMVETLAVVAYRQPITKAGVDAIRGQESEGSLRQLVRRGMLVLQGKDADNQPLYATSHRFLEFFHLRRVEELPKADDLERV